MADKLKGLFVRPQSIENSHLKEEILDENIGIIEGSKIAPNTITLAQLSQELYNLILPSNNIRQALANSMNPNASNPFVTRAEMMKDLTYWKQPVSSVSDLPSASSGQNSINDIRLVVENLKFYVWDGKKWNEACCISSTGNTTISPIEEGIDIINQQTFIDKLETDGIVFLNTDFTLNSGQYKEIIHDTDTNYNRIIQIKEKIYDSTCNTGYFILNTLSTIKTSNYSLENGSVSSSTNVLYGSNDIIWDSGIEGLIIEDINHNAYKIQSVNAQNASLSPKYVNIENQFINSYTGKVYISNIIVNNNEVKLIRQTNESNFTILSETSKKSFDIKKSVICGESISGITGITFINDKNNTIFKYNTKLQNNDNWDQYEIKYKIGSSSYSIQAKDIHVAHIITSPKNNSYMTANDNLNGNDMYAMVYIDKNSNLPYLVIWCHNFGNPILFERKLLDNSNNPNKFYYHPYISIRELKKPSDNITRNMKADPQTTYVIAITCGTTYTEPETQTTTGQIALWINDDAGSDFQSNWPTITTPVVSYIRGSIERPKVVLGPPMMRYGKGYLDESTTDLFVSDAYRIYIVYNDIQNKELRCIQPYHTDLLDPFNFNQIHSTQDDTETLFKSSQFGANFKGTFAVCPTGDLDPTCRKNQSVHMYNIIGQTSTTDVKLFNNLPNDKQFEISDSNNFDVAIWEDRNEIGRQQDISVSNDNQPFYCGVPVVIASNRIDENQICVTYKYPVSQFEEWTENDQETGRYGVKPKLKIEKQYSNNILNSEFSKHYASDILHIMYINDNINERAKIPCHIHNKYGCWIKEDTKLGTNEIYYSRQKTFSDAIEYLDFIGISEFDFDLDSENRVEFIAFYNSDDTQIKGLYYANAEYKCRFAIWNGPTTYIENGPGPRAGYTSFVYNNRIYIHGGYLVGGTVDGSIWTINLNTFLWSKMTATNSPKRVFHVSEMIENIITSTKAPNQSALDPSEIIFPEEAYGGYTHELTGGGVLLKLSSIQRRSCDINCLYQYEESCDYDSISNLNLSPDFYLATNEGYRDSLLNCEIYNKTKGTHSKISSISLQYPLISSPGVEQYVFIETESSDFETEQGDEIVITKPQTPPYDQLVIYGGGIGGNMGFPEDGTINSASDGSGASDPSKYLYLCNLEYNNCNNFIFQIASVASDGSDLAPSPLISGKMVFNGYSKTDEGEISTLPNLSIFYESNVYRFSSSYETLNNGTDFQFVGRWSKLSMSQINCGNVAGNNYWTGTVLKHYGGIKKSPLGHFTYPYKDSNTVLIFGGMSLNGGQLYQSSNLLVTNAQDIYPGWNRIIPSTTLNPISRSGNAIITINDQIEDPELNSLFEKYIDRDIDEKVWITCGNIGSTLTSTYPNATSLNDIWMGKIDYVKEYVNNSSFSHIVQFNVDVNKTRIYANVRITSSSGTYVVPNGIRTNDNTIDSHGNNHDINQSNYNDRYESLSINDINDQVYSIYNGSISGNPNWIEKVWYDINTDTYTPSRNPSEIGGYYIPDLLYHGPIIGERKWTCLGKLIVTIPEGIGSGDYLVYFGVYNNGMDSYVEYFLPEESYVGFSLAGIELSGGQYDPCDECDTLIHGKSWFDCSTGILHVSIKSTTGIQFGTEALPYVSGIEDVVYVKINNIKWNNMSNIVGSKPLKNAWGELLGNSKVPSNIGYFGGRTHQSNIVSDVFKWNPPSIFIQNEKTDLYNFSDIDGSDDAHWIQLKHGNIVRDSITARFSETLNYYVDENNIYAGFGVARIIFDNELVDLNKSARFVDIGFRIYHNGHGFLSDPNLGYIESEPTGKYDTYTSNKDLEFEGIINFRKGTIALYPKNTSTRIKDTDAIKIIDLNYHTYEGYDLSYYDINERTSTYERYIGDIVGGEYSTRINSIIYSESDPLEIDNISGFVDYRTWTYDLNNYDFPVNYTEITGDEHFEPNKEFFTPKWWVNLMKTHSNNITSSQLYLMANDLDINYAYLIGRFTVIDSVTNKKYVQYFKLNKLDVAHCELCENAYRPIAPVVCDLTDSDNISIIDGNNIIYPYSAVAGDRYATEISVEEWEPVIKLKVTINNNILTNKTIQIDFMYDHEELVIDENKRFYTPVDIPYIYKPSELMRWQDTFIRALISFDSGDTWKTYDDNNDRWYMVDINNILTEGIDIEKLRNIVTFKWSGWQNYNSDIVRQDIEKQFAGFIEGENTNIKILLGMKTNEPAHTPAMNEIIFNLTSGFYWEPKNFYQDTEIYAPNDTMYLRVKMISPNKTIIYNLHPSVNKSAILKATLHFKRN